MTAQPSPQGQRKTQEPKQPENRAAGQPQATSQQAQNPPSQPQSSQRAPQQGGGTEQREQGETGLARRDGGQGGRVTRRPEPAEMFDPQGAIRVGLLRLARNWQRNGSTYQAIYAYTQILIRYPDTGAADAAAEELLELAETLEREGRLHAALNIFNQLEQLT